MMGGWKNRTKDGCSVIAAKKQFLIHNGYMADYKRAKALVERAIKEGKEPIFESWF